MSASGDSHLGVILTASQSKSKVECAAKCLSDSLCDAFNVQESHVGVSGSILCELISREVDIDLGQQPYMQLYQNEN